MASTTTIDLGPVAHELRLPLARVENVIRLLDAGNTVPFITRYRKDQTGGMDEEQIRQVESQITRRRQLAERKQTILRSIEGQGKLTPELARLIDQADSTKRLEDLYLPFKPKKQTLATAARERALEPLAEEILNGTVSPADLDKRAGDFVNPDKQVATAADALLGVGHILAEDFSERADLRGKLRKIFKKSGKLVSNKADGVEEKLGQEFRDYFEYNEQLGRVPPHRVLAINRGEKAKILRVKVEADSDEINGETEAVLVPADHPHAEFLRGCARDALSRLVLPSLEREIRRELTEWAEAHAVEVFARNLRNLLLQPPLRGHRVLAVDPGFRSGCKLAALDEFGGLVDQAVVHLVGKEERKVEGRTKLVELIKQHNITVAALGNGTGCRETEELLADILANELKDQGVAYVIVNEAGASVYSTSPLGREEFPNFDATLRGAISIGRRMQDPLSELVKIDAGSIGVGLYQHDVKAKHLRTSLDAVVESCVNYVGVDLNTASPALLRYVSGLNQLTARRLYDYRVGNGPFKSREQLKEVPGFGEATFVQAAGFLKISGGENPLDETWIHPESYETARKVLERMECSLTDLADKEKAAAIAQRAASLESDRLAQELDVGSLLLKDILSQLARPGRDPREDLPKPIFKRGILKIDDLTQGMELTGSVLNVVDFGAFVDIGLHDSGLVHVSQLANRFVRDPHEVVAVGDIVKVWVLEVDKTRRRVSLTMIPPGVEKGPPRRGGGRPDERRKPEGQPQPQGQGAPAGGEGKAPAPPRPSQPRRPDGQHRPPGGRPPQRQDARRPQGQGQGQGQAAGHGGHNKPPPPPHRPKPKPKPLVPLTEGMKKGKEPLRTFGDLKQFIDLSKQPEAKPEPPPSAAAEGAPAAETAPVTAHAPELASEQVELPANETHRVDSAEAPAHGENHTAPQAEPQPAEAVAVPSASSDQPPS